MTGENAKSHYITAIGLFEKYISTLAANVYFDCPRKMSSAGMDSDKLFDLIIDCDEKDEMIDRIIEEKLRSITVLFCINTVIIVNNTVIN